MIKLDRLVDAKAVLNQAKEKGAKGDGFDKLGQRARRSGANLRHVGSQNQDPPQDQLQSLIELYTQGQAPTSFG